MSTKFSQALELKVENFRARYLNHGQVPNRPAIIWLTGLSGSGKTTTAQNLKSYLDCQQIRNCILDGDEVRRDFTSDLGFSDVDRRENIRRVALLAQQLVTKQSVVIVSLISPFDDNRALAHSINERHAFYIVYCKATLAQCEQRDPKGLYAKARAGLIKKFTGIDSNYEVPRNADLVLETVQESEQQCLDKLITLFKQEKLF